MKSGESLRRMKATLTMRKPISPAPSSAQESIASNIWDRDGHFSAHGVRWSLLTVGRAL